MRQKFSLSKSCRQLLALMILLLPILQSCDKSLLPGGGRYNFDIGNAKTLFIASQPLQTRAASQGKALTENKIFKVTESGATLEVNLTNDLGIIVSGKTMNPVAILPAGGEYLLFCFGTGNEFRYYINDAYLVNRSTGAAFQIQSEFLPVYCEPFGYYHLAVPSIQSDGDGNLYWIFNVLDNLAMYGNYNAIAKLSGLNGADVNIQRVTSSIENVQCFLVDNVGNIIYDTYPGEGNPKSRLLTKGNSVFNLGWARNAYVNLSGNIRYLTYELDGHFQISLNTIIDNGNDTVSFLRQDISNLNWDDINYYYKIDNKLYYFLRYPSKQYLAESKDAILFENINLNSFTEISSIKASDNKAYFSGMDSATSKLISFTPPNVFETLLPGPDGIEYDVSRFEVSSDDEVSFSALRLRDNKRVLGTIDALKQISIIGEEGDSAVSSLLQVN